MAKIEFTEELAKKAIQVSGIDMLTTNPFYGHVYCKLYKVFTDQIPTLAVGKSPRDPMVNLYVNTDYVKKIVTENGWNKAKDHFAQVLQHEMLHLIFKHMYLTEPASHRREIACELAVNSYIDRNKLCDKGVFPEDFGFQPELGFREYYKLLEDKMPELTITIKMGGGQPGDGQDQGQGEGQGQNQENQQGQGNGGQSQQGQQDQQGQGGGSGEFTIEIRDKNGKLMGTLDSHGKWGETDKDDSLSEIMIEQIISSAKEACQRTNKWGNMPSSLRGAIDDMLVKSKPSVDWQTALRDFIASSSETELAYTNKKISKRYSTRPGTKKYERLNIAVGIDTSGSIDNRTLQLFFSELEWIAKADARLTVFECDCSIGRSYPFEEFDLEDFKDVTGGGGTDLEPVIKEASDRQFDACIYFTDGYAPKIETDYNIPVLLVVDEYGESHLTREQLPYPAQMVFYVNADKVNVD